MTLDTFKRLFVPRIITEPVAFYCDHESDALVPWLPAALVDPEHDGEPDAVIPVRSLALLGVALFPRQAGEPVSWDEYLAQAGGSSA